MLALEMAYVMMVGFVVVEASSTLSTSEDTVILLWLKEKKLLNMIELLGSAFLSLAK